MRHYAKHVGLDPTFTVIDRSDAADLVDTVRTELGYSGKGQRFPRKDTWLGIYSYRVNTQKSLKETLESQYAWCSHWEEDIAKLLRGYVERKSQYRVLDFDDLLLYWHAMMSEDRIAKSVAQHFDHVLVDEYQDTNKLQGDILNALKPDGQGVTVVGDDAQAIYSFRAAAVENILGFPDRFRPKAETITLAQNFRSSQSILDAANALMADAPRQYRKHLLSMRGQGPRPKLVTVDDLPTQAEFICTRVLASREAGIPLRRQAVLFRTGTHSDVLEIELTKRKIPFVKYGGLKFLEAAHVKDLLAVLRWADNPRNQLAAFRVLQFMPGMGPANAKRALDHFIAANFQWSSFEKFEPPNDARIAGRSSTSSSPRSPIRIASGAARSRWCASGTSRTWSACTNTCTCASAISTSSSCCRRSTRRASVSSPSSRSIRRTPRATWPDQAQLDEDYLVLSTIHSAKGMEWDNVYVLNVVEGSFPNEFSTGKAELIEEERRLLYVAMTRARNELTCVVPLRFQITSQPKTSDGHVYGGRSRFLTEKVIKCFDEQTFQGSNVEVKIEESAADSGTIDVASRLKQMW